VAFVRTIVARLITDHGVDPDRIFATGMSNGAIFTYRLACDAPGLVRAIAPVAGTMPADYLSRCAPGQGTPVMIFAGTDDGLMPYGGGRPERSRLIGLFRGEVDEMVSAPDTLAFWARVNGCGGPPLETALADAADDGTTVTQIAFDCGAATLFRIEGGGHTWPGSTGPRVAPRLTGTVSIDIDATATMLAFFRVWGL
jgi:polyhydroxybutyrate depolymerase